MSSTLDVFRRSPRRQAARACSPARRRCRPTVERLEDYLLLAAVATSPPAQPLVHTLDSIATTTTLSAGADTGIVGQQITFVATVLPASGTGTPTGSVQFSGSNNGLVMDPILQPLMVVAGQSVATFTVTVFGPGPITVDASYRGDSAFAASSATPLTVTPNSTAIATTTTLSAGADLGTVGQQITFVATVLLASGTGTPTGTVQFYGNNDGLVMDPILQPLMVVAGQSVATFTVTVFGPGPITVDASYRGDSVFASSSATPLTVTPNPIATATATTLSASPAAATVGQVVTFTAAVLPSTGAGTPTGTVSFAIDGTPQTPVPLLVVGGQDIATFSTSSLGIGTHSVTATYDGDSSFASSTVAAPLSLTVTAATAPAPSLSLTGVLRSRQGVSAISLGFVAAPGVRPPRNADLYHLLGTVNQNGQTVYRKALGIRSVSVNAHTQTMTITLDKPHAGPIRVTVQAPGHKPLSIVVA